MNTYVTCTSWGVLGWLVRRRLLWCVWLDRIADLSTSRCFRLASLAETVASFSSVVVHCSLKLWSCSWKSIVICVIPVFRLSTARWTASKMLQSTGFGWAAVLLGFVTRAGYMRFLAVVNCFPVVSPCSLPLKLRWNKTNFTTIMSLVECTATRREERMLFY